MRGLGSRGFDAATRGGGAALERRHLPPVQRAFLLHGSADTSDELREICADCLTKKRVGSLIGLTTERWARGRRPRRRRRTRAPSPTSTSPSRGFSTRTRLHRPIPRGAHPIEPIEPPSSSRRRNEQISHVTAYASVIAHPTDP